MHNEPTVTLPNGNQISLTHKATLLISNTVFSPDSLQSYIFPQIKKLLLPIGKFCDDGKIDLFTKNKCIIFNDITKLKRVQNLININTLLQGTRDTITKLWNRDLYKPIEAANLLYHCTKIADTIDYHHRTPI